MKLVASVAVTICLSLVIGGCCGLAGGGTDKYLCKSKQAEGQTQLSALHVSATAAKAELGKYPKTLAEAGFSPTPLKYYDLSIVSATATGFAAEAKGKGDMAGDLWKIDETGKLSNPTDKCSK